VSAFGDLNGDSVNDMLVGAIQDDDGAPDVGAVWILILNGPSVSTETNLETTAEMTSTNTQTMSTSSTNLSTASSTSSSTASSTASSSSTVVTPTITTDTTSNDIVDICLVQVCVGTGKINTTEVDIDNGVHYFVSNVSVASLKLKGNSTLEVFNDINIKDTLLIEEGTLIVGGNLTLSPSSHTSLSNGVIQVAGCANFAGDLILTSKPEANQVLFTYACHTGEFSSIEINGVKCSNPSSQVSVGPTEMVILFSYCDATSSLATLSQVILTLSLLIGIILN